MRAPQLVSGFEATLNHCMQYLLNLGWYCLTCPYQTGDDLNLKKCQITHKTIGQCDNYNREVTHTKVFCRTIKHGNIFTNVHLK